MSSFYCHACGEKLAADSPSASIPLRCPSCGELIFHPAGASLPPAADDPPLAAVPARDSFRAVVFSLLALLLVGFLALLWFGPRTPRLELVRNFVFGSKVAAYFDASTTRPASDQNAPSPEPDASNPVPEPLSRNHSLGRESPRDSAGESLPGPAGADAPDRSPGVPDTVPDNPGPDLPPAAPRSETGSPSVTAGEGSVPPLAEDPSVISDEFTRRLTQAGARSGDVQISLMWNNVNDVDLHCVEPSGFEIYYQERESNSGGILDIDMNVLPPFNPRPVENIYWPIGTAPSGLYRVYVNHYRNNGARDPTHFVVRVHAKGAVRQVAGVISFGAPKRLVYQFVVR